MSGYAPIVSTDRTMVRDTYDQSRVPRLWEIFPRVKIWSYSTSKKIASYRLPALNDGLVRAGLPSWMPGQQPPPPNTPGEGAVTVAQTDGHHTRPDSNPVDKAFDMRFKRFRKKAPRHLDQCHRQIDISLSAALISSSNSVSSSFPGTGALDAPHASHRPDVNINTALRTNSIRDYQHYQGVYKLCAVMDTEVARVLARHPAYSGRYVLGSALGGADGGSIAGGSTGLAAQMPMPEFRAAFKAAHGLDEVYLVDGIYDSADEGVTSSISRIHSGLLWIGLLDAQSAHDLTTGDDAEGPDGAFAIALAQEPDTQVWVPPGTRMEYFGAFCEFKVITPRVSSDSLKMGIYYASSEIFT